MSLLRTAARASVATRVVGNVQRKQQRRWAAEDAHAAQQQAAAMAAPVLPPAAAAPAAASTATMIEQLTQLGQLRDAGVLTPAEFETQKQRILAG